MCYVAKEKKCPHNINCVKKFGGKNCKETQKTTNGECKKGETPATLGVKKVKEKKEEKRVK